MCGNCNREVLVYGFAQICRLYGREKPKFKPRLLCQSQVKQCIMHLNDKCFCIVSLYCRYKFYIYLSWSSTFKNGSDSVYDKSF